MSFDTVKFIKEVEARPSLWNNHSIDFQNKSLKNRSWRELCDIFVINFLAMDSAVQNREVIALQRKWKSLRDSFNRELKERRSGNITQAGHGLKHCLYFEQLSFLKPILEAKKRDSTGESQVEHLQEQGIPDLVITSPRKRKRSSGHTAEESPDSMEEGNGSDSDLQFIHSLLPYIRRLPPKNKMELKTAFMGIIKNYSKRKIIPPVVDEEVGTSRTTPALLNESMESQEDEDEVDETVEEELEEEEDVVSSDTSPGLSTGYTDEFTETESEAPPTPCDPSKRNKNTKRFF